MSWWIPDDTHDPLRTSWIKSANGHGDFPIQNLPLGVFSPGGRPPRIGTAIGDQIFDLKASADAGLLDPILASACAHDTLNALFELPVSRKAALRRRVSELLSDPAYRNVVENKLFAMTECEMRLPAKIGDYTDFYVGIHHARNVGRQFRPDNPLLPNYRHLPIGYHGRASSIRPSNIPVRRPSGQRPPTGGASPTFGPTARLDYELELGVWVGAGNRLGHPIGIEEAGSHVAGFCLLNDWSARDFQAWEYQPLGPFLSKNFHTTISPWVITAEAMAPFRIAQPARPDGDPALLPYLISATDASHGALAITLEVYLATNRMSETGEAPFMLSRGPASSLYWTVNQMLAHHTSGGCNLMPGDLLGTGTISAREREGFGSLLELSEGGRRPVALPNGEKRAFLEDDDEVTILARAHAPGFVSIGFGACVARILPANVPDAI